MRELETIYCGLAGMINDQSPDAHATHNTDGQIILATEDGQLFELRESMSVVRPDDAPVYELNRIRSAGHGLLEVCGLYYQDSGTGDLMYPTKNSFGNYWDNKRVSSYHIDTVLAATLDRSVPLTAEAIINLRPNLEDDPTVAVSMLEQRARDAFTHPASHAGRVITRGIIEDLIRQNL